MGTENVNTESGKVVPLPTPESGQALQAAGEGCFREEDRSEPPQRAALYWPKDRSREGGGSAERPQAWAAGQELVISRGDCQEDREAFDQLHEQLRKDLGPENVAEDLAVWDIARSEWYKMRSVRYEHGVILKRGADLRRQEERILKREFEDALR